MFMFCFYCVTRDARFSSMYLLHEMCFGDNIYLCFVRATGCQFSGLSLVPTTILNPFRV